ncbi:hypothetical protein DIE15_22505 [Burkholderia sp. Bp9031]|nr:hypothetical protein DIE15_22505 [Burkholderia sp. Bp9031]
MPRRVRYAGERVACICRRDGRLEGPVHANNGLALAPGRAERKECDEANTRRIRDALDAAIGPSGGQPHE